MGSIAFVSDAHIRHSLDQQAVDLLNWLDQIAVERICFLGDIFDVFWDYQPPHPTQAAFIAQLKDRLNGRIQIDFSPGNRDFSAARFFERNGARVSDVWTYNVSDRLILAAHGDQADLRFGYRLTKRVLRSSAFDLGMSWCGPHRGYQILNRLAGASREQMSINHSIVQQQRQWALHNMTEERQTIVVGHSHKLDRISLPNGELIMTGNWQINRNFVLWDGTDFQLCSF